MPELLELILLAATPVTLSAEEIKAMQNATDGISNYLGTRIPMEFFNHLRRERSKSAFGVLTTPELLALIFENADIRRS